MVVAFSHTYYSTDATFVDLFLVCFYYVIDVVFRQKKLYQGEIRRMILSNNMTHEFRHLWQP